MHHALVVSILQRVANLRDDLQRLARGEASGLFELAQVRAIHELHDEKVQPARVAEFVNCDDVGMIQPGQRTRLAVETLGEVYALCVVRRQNLQRHDAVERWLPRLIHRPHAARAERPEDFQLRKKFRDFFQ